ncbi:MAG: 1-deoxy-D-xylulose-5-phosphate synthase [Planctomycetota bacterium]
MPLLPTVRSPDDVKRLDLLQMKALALEIREEMIRVVSEMGGHLASNLGTVELCIALHHVFDFLHDRLCWDIGHQAYPHKLLTGRFPAFPTIKQHGGISGYPNRQESPYDPFTIGHAGSSISTALGLRVGDRILGRRRRIVVVVGDGSLTSGMAFEGLNHAGAVKEDLLVVLNDNNMFIHPSVGAMSRSINRVRMAPLYLDLKHEVYHLLRSIPGLGSAMGKGMDLFRDAVRRIAVPGMFFHEMGFRYFGPIDGHDLDTLIPALREIREQPGPILLHVTTMKGKGFALAEKDPVKFHGPSPFDPEDGTSRKAGSPVPYTKAFAASLIEIARTDPAVVAITAAMPDGTGLVEFQRHFPDRMFDVGIAEQHAVGFAAGLQESGLKPVVAIYSTFLQRAFDQVFQEVAVQPLGVTFVIDRAGIVGEDGSNHQGVYDIAYLRPFPGAVLMAPRDATELSGMLRLGLGESRPAFIRIPRDTVPEPEIPAPRAPLEVGRAEILRNGPDGAILAYGAMVQPAWEAADRLAREDGLRLCVVNARFAKPLDGDLFERLAREQPFVVTVEDHVRTGGFGSAVLEALNARGAETRRVHVLAFEDAFIPHGARRLLLRLAGLDADGIARIVRERARAIPSRGAGRSG